MSLDHIKIECISKELCQNCPELNIDVDHHNMVFTGINEGDMYECTNTVRCTHHRKCMRMMDYLEKYLVNSMAKDKTPEKEPDIVAPPPHLDKDGCVYWDKFIQYPTDLDDTE